jgi:hypothetical protein
MVQKFKIPKFRPQKVFWPGPPPESFYNLFTLGSAWSWQKITQSRLTQNQRSHLVKINSGQVRSVSKYLHMSSFEYFITSSSLLLLDVD